MERKIEALLERFASEAEAALGPRLLTLALYGSAVTGEYLLGESDLNLLVLLDRVDPPALAALQKPSARWRKKGAGFPLLLDRDDLARSLDSFPLEFLDLKLAHRILRGDDCLAGLQIDPAALRVQCEREIKGKLILMQRGFFQANGDAGQFRLLFRESIKALISVIRGMLWLEGASSPPLKSADVLRGLEEKTGRPLPNCRRALEFRLGRPRISLADAEELFSGYLAEVKQLADWVDRWEAGK